MDSRVRALYKIEPQPEGPAQARRIIADELAGRLSAPALDDVKLMVSELVTNGIVHGSTEPDEPVMLDLLVNGNVRCRVLDHGRGFATGPSSDEAGGWGLQVVEQLSDRWGMQCSPQQTEVWFERHCS
ncbi:MAG TPA: ATP-binding protein [Solirubrobacteraceae bacterium]|nr:ATP-binding protein [Solirubrobacteraceae bacterium]